MTFFVLGCVLFALVVVGATYAYFTASANDNTTVKGDASTVSFGLTVTRVTTIDMAYGLIPMKNNQAPYAASNKCYDSNNNVGCQLYKITVSADSDTVMFLDGYIFMTPRDERLETRIARVYTDDDENYYTKFTKDDFDRSDFKESDYIKTGVDVGRVKNFYVMVWVYDNGEAQDYLQGMELAYQGVVNFVTAEGNEISATFD